MADNLQERLRTLIDADFHGMKPPVTRKGVLREWIADLLGCSAPTLSSNFGLRRMIKEWEGKNLKDRRQAPADVEAANDNVVFLARGKRTARIILAIAKIHGHLWEIPTIIWNGVQQVVNDWFRYLVVKLKRDPSSVEETAKHMRQFLKYCRKNRIKLEAVDDDVLIDWRSELTAEGIRTPRRNTLLRTIHSFYKWTAEQKIFKYIVQIARPSAYPEAMLDYSFPISSQEEMIITRKGRKRSHWVWPFLEHGEGSKYGRRPTPTFEDIDRATSFTDTQVHGVRNVLMMIWAFRTGARVSEILSMRLKDLPWTDEQQAEMIEKGQWAVKLRKRKRRPSGGVLYVPQEVIFDTIDYIETERALILKKRGKKGLDRIFVSERGTPIVADSVSRICSALFRAAQVPNAGIHRLRARFAHHTVEVVLQNLEEFGVSLDSSSGWHETALIIAAQMMGHSSPRSLEPYLHDIVFRRAEAARLGLAQTADTRPPSERPDLMGIVVEATRLLENGEEREAGRLLRRVTGEIDRRRLWQGFAAAA